MLKRLKSLIIKEFIAIWLDKKSRVALVIFPILQLFIFSFAATLDVKNIDLGILNKDMGKLAYEFTERFQGSPFFKKIVFLDRVSEIRQVMDRQKVLGVIHIDEQFSRNLLSNQRAKIQLILDGRRSNSAQIVQGYIAKIIDEYNKDLLKNQGIDSPAIELIPRNWFNSNLNYIWFTVPGLVAILSMLTTLIVTSQSIARERELGTFEQLLVTPLLPFEILIGKTIPGIVVGLLEGTVIILAAIFAFQIPFTGSIIALYLSLLVFIGSIVGIGLFISSLAKTQQQALLGVFIVMPPSVILSGFATPIENMPQIFQMIAYINPLKYFLIIIRGIFLKELPLSSVLSNLYPMLIIAVVVLTASTWFFRRRLE